MTTKNKIILSFKNCFSLKVKFSHELQLSFFLILHREVKICSVHSPTHG